MRLLSPEEYQPAAEAAFEAIASRLAAVLPRARIEHVGASSVPGAISKGDLDVCVIVERAEFSAALDQILALGYRVKPDTLRADQLAMLIPRLSSKREDDHAIQLVEAGSKFEFFLTFRDLLRNDPGTVSRYNAMKRRAANQTPTEYRSAKSAFIAAVLAASRPSV